MSGEPMKVWRCPDHGPSVDPYRCFCAKSEEVEVIPVSDAAFDSGMWEEANRLAEEKCEQLEARYEGLKERLLHPKDWRAISGAASLLCPEPSPCPRCIVQAALEAAEKEPGDA